DRRLGRDGLRVPCPRQPAGGRRRAGLGAAAGRGLRLGPGLMPTIDLDQVALREVNGALHRLPANGGEPWLLLNPKGRHNIAVGLTAPVAVEVRGHAGYYCAGM